LQAQYITTILGAAVELYTRSAGVAFFLGGAVLCAVSVKGVKRLIRQPRPPNHLSRKTTYGMPSTHSATISYFAASVLLASGYLPLHPAFPNSPLFRASAALGMGVWALLVSASRIWLGHHSVLQVAVGSAYGIGFAATWFVLWTSGGW
ncbi:phosphatidic acid phosphatase type 2/haloperoxidase, partial [Exidia glandulosa HHB12029]